MVSTADAAAVVRDLEDARTIVEGTAPSSVSRRILQLVEENDTWRDSCLNLNAAESVMSPTARRIVVSDLYARSMPRTTTIRPHGGRRYIEQIEWLLDAACTKLFSVKHSECRPPTASGGESVVLHALTNVGDSILGLESIRGHRTWNAPVGYSGMRGLNVLEIPYDYEEWNIDVEKLKEIAKTVTSAPLVIVGSPLFLFPYPVQEVRGVADDIGAKVWYDAAHVLGLIAGGQFQDPLREGAHLITGSAQKTFSGPVGGMILTDEDEIFQKVDSLFAGHFSIFGHSRMAALAITVLEWMEFGRDFAQQIVSNTKALGAALDGEGFDVMAKEKGYTQSHTIAVNTTSHGGGESAVAALERSNIIGSAFMIWSPQETFRGLRFGVAEMTRYGMKEREMKEIGRLVRARGHRQGVSREGQGRGRGVQTRLRSRPILLRGVTWSRRAQAHTSRWGKRAKNGCVIGKPS